MAADAAGIERAAGDQGFPGALATVHGQQLQGHLVDLGDFYFLQQLLALPRVILQPAVQVLGRMQAVAFKKTRHAGEVEHTQGNATAFENILVAPAPFFQGTFASAHAEQPQYRQQRTQEAQQQGSQLSEFGQTVILRNDGLWQVE
ncbi:hypothetical protein D3C76_1088220 [compost metagenome]